MYEHQEYPKWVYKGDNGKIVQDVDEHEAAKTDGYGELDAKSEVKPKRTRRTKEQIEADKAEE